MELMVVMAIVALLLAIAVPRYLHSTDKAREAVLMENLARMRAAIDSYHADRGRYPDRLEDLVERKYLRSIPTDPITETAATWQVVPPENTQQGEVADVRSGAPGKGLDGRPYADW
jgi:general secretion pathway protein G